jgi:phage regulator Rha-like protein
MTKIININKVQTMTSLEIAELTGKQHKNVMQAIRNMEPAWEKVTGLKFQLCEKSYLLANGVTKKQPFYQLTKTECLYIATKFNDEARAKLVLRWQELEMADGFATPHSALQRRRKMSDVRCLPEPKKILALADEIIGEGLRMMNEPAEDTLTATQVARRSICRFMTSTAWCATWASSTAATDAGTSRTTS